MKLKLLSFPFILLFSIFSVFSQQTAPTPLLYSDKTLEEMRRIQKFSLESDYALKQTAYLTNNIGPRLTGSPQAERAVQYVAERNAKTRT